MTQPAKRPAAKQPTPLTRWRCMTTAKTSPMATTMARVAMVWSYTCSESLTSSKMRLPSWSTSCATTPSAQAMPKRAPLMLWPTMAMRMPRAMMGKKMFWRRRYCRSLVTYLAASAIWATVVRPPVSLLTPLLRLRVNEEVVSGSRTSTKSMTESAARSYHVASQSAFQPPLVPFQKICGTPWSGTLSERR